MIETTEIENNIKKFTYFFFFLVLIFLISLSSFSQKVYNLEASYLFGSNINKATDREFGQTSPIGVELSFHRYRNGNNYWEKDYNYPHTGWSLTWIDHRNKTLGCFFSLNRYINFVFWRRKYFDVYLKISQGIMYTSQVYESSGVFNERFNNAISQQLNFSNDLGLGCNIYFAQRFGLSSEVTVSHFSNGAISQPNDGLNLLRIKLGLIYVVGDRKNIYFKQPEKLEDNKKIRFNINLAGGVKQLTAENEKKYPLFTLSAYFDKKLTRVNALNFGADIFINTGVKYNIENNAAYKGKDFKRVGISAGHELFIGRVGVLTQIGYHLYSPYPAIAPFYQKFGLKYYITNKIFAMFTVRMFKFEVSDEVVFGFGLRL